MWTGDGIAPTNKSGIQYVWAISWRPYSLV